MRNITEPVTTVCGKRENMSFKNSKKSMWLVLLVTHNTTIPNNLKSIFSNCPKRSKKISLTPSPTIFLYNHKEHAL